jgi:5-methylcytosine-specific restriction endonuclease McrA
MVALPRWNDPALKAGTMIRAGLWLVSEVGEGQIFTKEQVRQTFPGVSQIDRRIRDLRDFGWVIHTNSDDGSLNPEEQRLVHVGTPVWDPEARRRAAQSAITAAERAAVLAADNHQCVICGVAGGEDYPDSSTESAVLAVSRQAVQMPDGRTEEHLITLCRRCRSGRDQLITADLNRWIEDVRVLDAADQQRLARWVARGRRGPTPLDRVWSAFRALPADARTAAAEALDRLV